jgi:hypothetical protein
VPTNPLVFLGSDQVVGARSVSVICWPAWPHLGVEPPRFSLDARRIYTVDFWSPASGLAFVDSLTQATLCYRSPVCDVTFTVQTHRTACRSLPLRN